MKNKKILLAVCGSISFYKAFEILSLLKKEEADVYVMLSDGALEFVDYSGFEALCSHRVLCSKTQDWQAGVNHINYADMDLIMIAPASANTINKLANGICDNVFMQTLIASNAPLLIAPAANEKMLEHPSTKKSIKFLKDSGAVFVPSIVKILACGYLSKGALAEPCDIVQTASRTLHSDPFYKNKTVVITGGATIEKIDDIRGITNFSSGKMAKALADAYYIAGANVVLITSVDTQAIYKVIKFESTIGLQSAIKSLKLKENDMLLMAAAVSDYIPNTRIKGKAKKEDFGEIWNLRLGENIDILKSFKNEKFTKIGFKLEIEKQNAVKNAKKMLSEKNLDAVCLNVIDEVVKFGGDNNKITFITQEAESIIDLASKQEVATKIVNLTKSL